MEQDALQVVSVEDCRRVAGILGDACAAAKAVALFDSLLAEGKHPVIVKVPGSLLVLHDACFVEATDAPAL